MEAVYRLLNRIGMRPHFSGYDYLARAIQMVLQDRRYMQRITQRLFVDIAVDYGVTRYAVEAAIRRVIVDYWTFQDKEDLGRIAGRKFSNRPSTSEMIAVLSEYLRSHPEALR